MSLDSIESLVQLLTNVLALLICLFQYISSRNRAWVYASAVFLSSLLSCYYWTVYLLIMGETPNISVFFSYFGWDVAYLFLLLLVIHTKGREERRYFHPLMLLPVPLGIWQIYLYSQFSGALNSAYQVTVLTLVACLGIQSFCWYRKHRTEGAEKPYIALAAFLLVCFSFGMWIASCYDEPILNLYYPFSLLNSANYLFIPAAIALSGRAGKQSDDLVSLRYQKLMKLVYMAVVLICCVGGTLFGFVMKNQTGKGLGVTDGNEIIPVTLFLISLFLVAFAVAIIFVVSSWKRASTETRKSKINLLIPVVIIFCLMVSMVVYTSRVIQNVSVTNIHEVGEDKIASVAAQLENYLEMTKSTLWVTADTVDHMSQNGATPEEILKYITAESKNQEQHFDENYTGIYGFVQGEYLDGVGWKPPAGYVPTERDWYREALKAKGDATIVPPYVDAQTHAVIISISRMLSNGTDVLSLDVTMNHIQDTVGDLTIKGKGYGLIIDRDGLVIAHQNVERKGTVLNETREQRAFLRNVRKTRDGEFTSYIGGQKSTVFVQPILDQWYAVIIVSNKALYAEVWQQLIVNIAASIVIFVLIALFYLLGYKNEQNYSIRIEEMRVEEQKKAYEAKALKLEKEAADQANKAKSDFLAEMSHEIRTPINAVLGMNEMILRETERSEGHATDRGKNGEAFRNIRNYAGNIESAGRNLLAIINDILDFSKIEAGRMDIAEGPYRFSSVLNDVSNMIFFKAKEKGLTFSVDLDGTIPDELYGDEVRVRQVITNILNNAVKYTERGSVVLRIRGELKEERIHLQIAVEDTGIGIRPEDQEKLFVKFQRLDLKTNSTVEGTGLGLAITQSLLAMMSGSIQVESEYGVGSTFTVLLPQKVISAEPIGDFQKKFEKNLAETKTHGEGFRAPTARILIVDDTRMNLKVAVGLLKGTGMRIETAESGEEAVALASVKVYDLILMDQRMPKMDGTEALKRIRAVENGINGKTPVICVTADAVMGARERYLAEGFTDYLTKPIDSRIMDEMLMQYLPADKVEPAGNGELAEYGTVEAAGVAADAERESAGVVADAGVEAAGVATDAGVETAGVVADAPEETTFEGLRAVGIDPAVGLSYCQQDASLYRELLEEYACSAESARRDIRVQYGNMNWKEYSVRVHALKSSSRMIGAAALGEIAARLEVAAEKAMPLAIAAEHDEMLRLYKETAQGIETVIGIKAENHHEVGEEEVLEFFPE